MKVNALRQLTAILRDPKTSDRNKLAAIRVLIAADSRNLEQQRIDILKGVTGETLKDIAAQLEALEGEHDAGSEEDSEAL